eukprot:640197-Lingulodinium_polyedra.AAC.1
MSALRVAHCEAMGNAGIGFFITNEFVAWLTGHRMWPWASSSLQSLWHGCLRPWAWVAQGSSSPLCLWQGTLRPWAWLAQGSSSPLCLWHGCLRPWACLA